MADRVHVVCPNCDAVNRMPRQRLADNGKCGKCGQALFDGQPAGVDGTRFARHIEQSGIPVLVDFWAPWCGPCLTMAPHFAKAAGQLEPEVRLLKLDTEAFPEVGGRLGIRSIPTLILFSGGREIARNSGAMNAASVVDWVRSNVAVTQDAH